LDRPAFEALAVSFPPARTPAHERRTDHRPEDLRSQSLAAGVIGHALLDIERAHAGREAWQHVHDVIASVTQQPLVATQDASLFFGAPAVAFVLHCAAIGTGRYTTALRALDDQVAVLTTRKLVSAHQRIDQADHPHLAEFDLVRGLTGFGAYLLRWHPDSDLLRQVLVYLVRLSCPLPGNEELPGWWTRFDPVGGTSPAFGGGHGNLGMAHGICGPLALLALAMLGGHTVDGHAAAITRICAWLDTTRQEARTGLWWPQWIISPEQRSGRVTQVGPGRPSWCYGTPGLARAQQLAGLALADTARQELAEQALLDCLDDPSQLGQIRDAGLCHGAAGLLHVTRHVARDARSEALLGHLTRLHVLLYRQRPAGHPGLLEGDTGLDLVLLANRAAVTASGWDACLLAGINTGQL
jgi:lantibiotic biosynthesis protein